MNKTKLKTKAVFFDRDGTLIDDVGYLSRLDDVALIPSVIPLARSLMHAGYLLFVVTNQSGVARGYFDEAFVHKTHQYLQELLHQYNITITQFYYCPHHPDSGTMKQYVTSCTCRKPQPGMLHQAAQDWNIDLTQSLMFGDKERDVDAGRAAGCASFLMRS